MLQGRTVRLRAIEPEHGARARAWLNDPAVTRYVSDRYAPAAGDEFWLGRGPANSFQLGVRLAIETNAGEHIGGVKIDRIRPEDRKALMAVVLGEAGHWSNGYGADAIATTLRFAFHEMNLHRVWVTVVDGDEAALACYRACGLREEARLRREVYRHGEYADALAMGILRDEFDARRNGAREGGM